MLEIKIGYKFEIEGTGTILVGTCPKIPYSLAEKEIHNLINETINYDGIKYIIQDVEYNSRGGFVDGPNRTIGLKVKPI